MSMCKRPGDRQEAQACDVLFWPVAVRRGKLEQKGGLDDARWFLPRDALEAIFMKTCCLL